MAKMETSMPTLETILNEVDQFVESNKVINENFYMMSKKLLLNFYLLSKK